MPTRCLRIVLLALCVLTIGTTASSTAQATGLLHEDSAQECSAVTPLNHGVGSGGCKIHLVSTAQIEFGTPLGMIFCDSELEGRLDGAGSGFAYSQSLTNCNASVAPCNESGVPDNWPLYLTSETSAEIVSCIRAFTLINITCHLPNVSVTQISHIEIVLQTNGHSFCEGTSSNSIAATWITDADANHPGIVIVD